MKQQLSCASALAFLAALSACGGSGTAPNNPPPVTRLYATDDGTVGKAIQDDKTLTAQSGGTATYEINWNNNTTTLKSGTFKVFKNASGELSMVVDGKTYDFAPGDRFVDPSDGLVYEYQVDGATTGVWLGLWQANGDTLDQTLDPTQSGYAQVWGYYVDADQNGIAQQGYAVVGTETKPADLALLPSATYTGRARMDVVPETGYTGNSNSRTRVRSDMDLSADFGAGTIAGSLTNITVQPPGVGQTAVPGTVSMDPTTLAGNGFAGSLTPDAAFIAGQGAGYSANGTYAGIFYGPAAQQVAGTLNMTGTDTSGNWNGTGYFIGTQN